MKKITIEIDVNTKGMKWCSVYNEPLYGDIKKYVTNEIETNNFTYAIKEA